MANDVAYRITDVPSPIDLRVASDALEWTSQADRKRPYREQMRGAIADIL
jgi:hypothetical protein